MNNKREDAYFIGIICDIYMIRVLQWAFIIL